VSNIQFTRTAEPILVNEQFTPNSCQSCGIWRKKVAELWLQKSHITPFSTCFLKSHGPYQQFCNPAPAKSLTTAGRSEKKKKPLGIGTGLLDREFNNLQRELKTVTTISVRT
jgi:hypothetical protein